MKYLNSVLILGSNGMLGHILSRSIEKEGIPVIKLDRSVFDPMIHKIENLINLFKTHPKLIINCIAVNSETSSMETLIQINSVFPKQLSYFCELYCIKLIHISTNGVFSGSRGNYLETDVPDANNYYGISKFLGENPVNSLIIRTSIIGFEKTNDKKYLLEWFLSKINCPVQGYSNHFWNGLTSLHLAEFIIYIFNNSLYENGLFHINSPEKISKYELLNLINEIFDLNIKINLFKHNCPDDKSLFTCKKLGNSFCFKSIKDQLNDLRKLSNL